MEPRPREIESKKVAKLLLFVYGKTSVFSKYKRARTNKERLEACANSAYGDEENCDKLTDELCSACKILVKENLADQIIYNGHSAKSRQLADWWENHKKVDAARERQEKAERTKALSRAKALAKLNKKDKIALGLSLE